MDRHQVIKLSKIWPKMKLIPTFKVSIQTQTTKVAHEDLHLSQLKNKIVLMPPKLKSQLPKLPKLLETTIDRSQSVPSYISVSNKKQNFRISASHPTLN